MIRLIRPYVKLQEIEDGLREIFDSGQLTKGKFVRAFASSLREYTEAQYAFLTTSATTALSICLELVGVTSGDEVIVSDFSFPATANVVENIGARPVFADVRLDTYNMSTEELQKKITPRTKAIIYVDAFGNLSGLHQIKELAQAHDIPLIEDAACAIGGVENGKKSGVVSDLTCFSFHPRKLITTGEGGAILTNHEKYAERLEIKLNHGANISNGKLDFVDSGFNYRMPEISALVGVAQMFKINDIIKGRARIYEDYKEGLMPLGFSPQAIFENVTHNFQSMVFTVPENVDRDELILNLKELGIETTLGTYSLSNCSYYKMKYNQALYNSLRLEKETITLPGYDGLDTAHIIQSVMQVLNMA